MKYKNQIDCIKRKDKTLGIDAYCYAKEDGADAPLEIYAPYSRFVFTILEKGEPITANLPLCDFPLLRLRSNAIAVSAETQVVTEDTPRSAPTFMYGRDKGRTPAEVLASNGKEYILKAKDFLLSNIDKYPSNQILVDEITRVISEGANVSMPAVASSPPIVLYESDVKYHRKKNEKGDHRCYKIKLTYSSTRKYPITVQIENMWAPIKKSEGGQTTISLSEAKDKVSATMSLSLNEWVNIVDRMHRTLNAFENMVFPKVYPQSL